MKRIIYLTIIAGLFCLGSCQKFLEESSPDLIRPITVENYKELLQGDSYFKGFYNSGCFIDVMTDDVMVVNEGTSGLDWNSYNFLQTPYNFEPDLEVVKEGNAFVDQFFQMCYKNNYIANACLYGLDKAQGSEAERAVVRAQALFIRSFAYFCLANTYSKPYDESTPDELCVPINLDITPSMSSYGRNTMKEVWDLIWNDVTESMELFSTDTKNRTVFEINYRTVLIYASRVALFMGKYDKVIEIAQKYITSYPQLRDISAITARPSTGGSNANVGFLMPSVNPEVSWLFSGPLTTNGGRGNYGWVLGQSILYPVGWSPSEGSSDALLDLYETGDRRRTFWFPAASMLSPAIYPLKVTYYDGIRFSQTFRSAEVYLNLAEACMRNNSPDPGRALSLMNTLRKARFDPAVHQDKSQGDFAGNDAILKFVLDERRRELCFEQFFRWWDLRRLGMPSITHRWPVRQDVYTLKQGDSRYVLNFPKAELEYNLQLVPNNRFQ